eukprot:m.2305 g.2305  ORF g.2305 m.2305 type:complete len:97 (+) comp2655_c0_seq1:86-376(+)
MFVWYGVRAKKNAELDNRLTHPSPSPPFFFVEILVFLGFFCCFLVGILNNTSNMNFVVSLNFDLPITTTTEKPLSCGWCHFSVCCWSVIVDLCCKF